MSLYLSASERRILAATQRAMTAPLAYDDFSAWQIDVNGSLRELLGGDHVVTFHWGESRIDLVSDDTETAWLNPVRKLFIGYDPDGNAMFEREVERGSLSRFVETLHRTRRMLGSAAIGEMQLSWTRDMKSTDLFQSTHVPAGICFMLGLCTRLPIGEVTTCVAFERSDAAGFTEESLFLLELLVPAYEAGVRVWREAGGYRQILEAAGIAVAVVGPRGKMLFESEELDRLLGDEPDAGLLLDEVRSEARRFHSGRWMRSKTAESVDPGSKFVSTDVNRYEILASPLRQSVFGSDAVLVVVRPCTPVLATPTDMNERFGLTPREAEVADLIARGLDNKSIAERLFISPHTARRHTERVLAKLGVDSRAAVAISLMRPN